MKGEEPKLPAVRSIAWLGLGCVKCVFVKIVSQGSVDWSLIVLAS